MSEDKSVSVRAVVATDQVDSSGYRFSKECLEALAGTEGIPVTINFQHENPVGVAKCTRVDMSAGTAFMVVEMHLDPEVLAQFEKSGARYFVPGGFIEKFHSEEESLLVYDKVKVTEISLVDQPRDSHLPAVNFKEVLGG
jgi:hypothetical protein